ncbi:hypothetical protein BGW37DRAFT_483153 [Umbelopsis sp. PMI_123]|nr:hypothetical protein BGW37DRAFT_483153 [Umbelopsis sp. PMI_123]
MLPPCLGYDSSNNVYRFAVTENGTTADVQKLTGTTNIEWQTVLAVNNVPASGECYFDSHSFTFGIVANLTSLDGGNVSALEGVFYKPIANATSFTQVLVPAYNGSVISYQNNNNFFASVDYDSSQQCLFSFEPQNNALLYTCYSGTTNPSSTGVNSKWLMIMPSSYTSANTNSSSSHNGAIQAAGQAQSAVTAAASVGLGGGNGAVAITSTDSASTTTAQLASSVAQVPQAQPTATQATPSNCVGKCQTNGVLVATQSHVLLLGWPNAQSLYHGSVGAALSDVTSGYVDKFSLVPIGTSISFSPGTAVGISTDAFAYLTYGNSPKLQYYNISSNGSITPWQSPLSVTTDGSNLGTANMLLSPLSIPSSSSSSLSKRDASSPWLITSSMDDSGKLYVVATNPENPSATYNLDNGDALPAYIQSAPSSPTNVGAIVGGVIGGIAIIVIFIIGLIFYRRRARRSKFSKASAKERGIRIEDYRSYIDERPGHQNGALMTPITVKMEPQVPMNGAQRQDTLDTLTSPIQNTFSPVIPHSQSKIFLPDFTESYLHDMNIGIPEYTGSDGNDLRKDPKSGTHILGKKYALTSEPPTRITTYYTVRTANRMPDKIDQVSIHFFKEPAVNLQLAQVGFATKLAGNSIINHIESYKIPGDNGYTALSVTDICSPSKSLYRLLHPAPGDLTLADTTDQYFQSLTIKSLLQCLQVLQNQKLTHTNLSTHSFFHEGGMVTEWKLGKLEDCRVIDDYIGDCDVCETTPPEILNGIVSHINLECNIWSLGVVIYEIITGKPLFKTIDAARQFANSGVSVNLDGITNNKAKMLLSCLLQIQPKQRSKVEGLLFIWDEDGAGRVDYGDDDDLDSIEGY